MIDLSLRLEFKGLAKSLSAFEYRQLPFAQAQAVNALGARVQKAEGENLKKQFPTLTPFTAKAVGLKRATKADPTAVVFVKPVAAKYLEPFENRGTHFLGSKKALLVPIDQATNQYGNLPRGTLAALKGRPDVFIGAVKTKRGTVNGVWQRVTDSAKVTLLQRTKAGKVASLARTKAGKVKALRNRNEGDSLKLLIRFKDSPVVKQSLGFGTQAKRTVATYWRVDFDAAMAQAVGSAR
jgi:hypothetical protein